MQWNTTLMLALVTEKKSYEKSLYIRNCITSCFFPTEYLPKSIYNNRQSKVLFTPGPLMVSDRVKEAMIPDICTRHVDFEYVVQYVVFPAMMK